MDFDTMIAKALAEGISAEDIAAKVSAALNKSKENEKKKPQTRETMIEGISKIFDEHVKKEHLDLSDAAALIWLCIVQDTDIGKDITSPEELSELLVYVTEDVGHMAEKWEMQKALKKIFCVSEHECSCGGACNKSKEKKEERNGGTGRVPQSDREIIEGFLKHLLS